VWSDLSTHCAHDGRPARDTAKQRHQASRRRDAFDRKDVPPELQTLIDKVEAHAYKVTDDDVRQLQAKYSDDELFEIIVSAALGASERRLVAGLEALDKA
jgi:hypothetical protein